MSMVDVIHERLQTAMCRVLEGGLDPTPMLAFCRGEVDMGAIQCPPMPEGREARIEMYKGLARFMSIYGATEAVFTADTVMSQNEDPNADPDAVMQLYYLRLPAGERYLQPYWIDEGHVTFEDMRYDGQSDEILVEYLGAGLGWAPQPLLLRQAGPTWLQQKMPGSTVGMMPTAIS